MPAKPKKSAKPKTKPKKNSIVKFQENDKGVVLRISSLGFAASVPRDFNLPIILNFTKNRGHQLGTVPPVKDEKVPKGKAT